MVIGTDNLLDRILILIINMFLAVLLFALLAVLVGLSFTFAGYRFMRILLPLWGFFAGLALGASALSGLMGTSFMADVIGLVVGFFIGVVFAVLAYFFYSFAIILIGATVGYTLGAGFMMMLGFSDGLVAWLTGVALGAVFAFAFAVLKMPKFLLVVLTAFGGAMAIIYGVLVLFGQLPMGSGLDAAKRVVDNHLILGLIWVGVALFGVMTQYAMDRQENWGEVYVVPSDETKPETAKVEPKEETK